MKNRRTGIMALSVVVLGVCFAALLGAFAYRRFQEGAPGQGSKPGWLDIGGRTRTYLLHVPPAYDGQRPLPLVLVLHGGGQRAESAERMSAMSAKADRENFFVAYPSGTGRSSRVPTWNSGNCCGYAMENKVDDVAFLRALINKLEDDYSVDPRRIFVTGISNGGMMSYRIGCELADQIAAIAPVEGAQNIDCRPSGPVSVIVFHGTKDRLVPFHGGSTPFQIGSKRSDNSVANAVAFWVKEDGCSPTPQHEENGAVHTDIYSGCKSGTGVALYAIQGGRHSWPGGRPSGNSVPATDLMWSFFLRHPKQ
jgi:polyhydroxybutyrate depolymerase